MIKPNSTIYLASSSPQRVALLKQIGIIFEQVNVDVPEVLGANEACDDYICRLAVDKAQAAMVGRVDSDAVFIGADTVILIKGQILEKPTDELDARNMLLQLSGKTHNVKTAVAVCNNKNCEVIVQSNQVVMGKIDNHDITAYWQTGEPHNKAGAYGIQGIGAQFITHIEGSYSGIMGLPIYETVQLLKHFGVKCL